MIITEYKYVEVFSAYLYYRRLSYQLVFTAEKYKYLSTFIYLNLSKCFRERHLQDDIHCWSKVFIYLRSLDLNFVLN